MNLIDFLNQLAVIYLSSPIVFALLIFISVMLAKEPEQVKERSLRSEKIECEAGHE